MGMVRVDNLTRRTRTPVAHVYTYAALTLRVADDVKTLIRRNIMVSKGKRANLLGSDLRDLRTTSSYSLSTFKPTML